MPQSITPTRRPLSRALPSLTREMDQLQASIRRMFANPLVSPSDVLAAMPRTIGFVPAVEISESADEITVTAELPGMEIGNVHVELDDDVLTLRGEKQEERKEGDEKSEYHLVERSYGAFQRSFTLPGSVRPDDVTAEFAKGVLTVHLPKAKNGPARGREILIEGR